MSNPRLESVIYQEWQLPRASTFIPHLMVFPSFWLVLAPINADLGLALGILASALSVWIRFAMSKKIIVSEEFLQIGKATIPRSVLGQAIAISESEQFNERGPRLDARAFVALKALSGLVKVQLEDSNDPTPYVLISTRRPTQLVETLNKN
jgi:hypothetical protein